MKIEFVNLPKTFIDTSEIAPPLGLLRLAAAGRSCGHSVGISDFNLNFHLDELLKCDRHFYAHATDLLLETNADVFCFTSMAVDSHVALHLARLIKAKKPESFTVVGGTHFGPIATDVIARYPWIDFVVTREGESFIGQLPDFVRKNVRRAVVEGCPQRVDEILDLPYDLIDLRQYFLVNPNRNLDLETGRGCRFKCAFCYSPNHYEGFRNFPIDRAIAGLEEAYGLGFRNVFFVEDNFLNDGVRARDLCKEIERAELEVSWQAYVTFPQLSSEIISQMARAGCTAVFSGIDAIGPESRRIHKKAFVRDADELHNRVHECVSSGITPTCAFLLSPPSYPGGSDLDETLFFALAARNAGAEVRLNSLTLYNRTGSFLSNLSIPEYDDFKVRLMLDVPKIVEENCYAVQNPELFPFHSRYVGSKEWQEFVSLVHCLFTLLDAFPKTLEYLWEMENIKPREIARRMMDNIGHMLDIPKTARRDAQLLSAVQVLEGLALRTSGLQPLLEMESDRILVFN
jgi:hypothetical protein